MRAIALNTRWNWIRAGMWLYGISRAIQRHIYCDEDAWIIIIVVCRCIELSFVWFVRLSFLRHISCFSGIEFLCDKRQQFFDLNRRCMRMCVVNECQAIHTSLTHSSNYIIFNVPFHFGCLHSVISMERPGMLGRVKRINCQLLSMIGDIYDSKVPHQRQIELVWRAQSFFMMCAHGIQSVSRLLTYRQHGTREIALARFGAHFYISFSLYCKDIYFSHSQIVWELARAFWYLKVQHVLRFLERLSFAFEQIPVICLHQPSAKYSASIIAVCLCVSVFFASSLVILLASYYFTKGIFRRNRQFTQRLYMWFRWIWRKAHTKPDVKMA